ncbi:MAG: PHP domain-containing protein [Lachnospiraceae bacterium]|jgi:predicted metal-dependent phosphoesterase TrpH
MPDLVDLHVHSNCSDGTYTPAQLVDYALEKGLRAFALTDHDTTEGIAEAQEAAKGRGLEVIPGIELSTNYYHRDIHMLGLGIDPENVQFEEWLTAFQNSRDIRNEKMIQKMQEAGINITWEEMLCRYPDAVWTRAHFARYLIDEGYVRSSEEAFARYLGDHARCFVPREKVTPFQAVQLIHAGGGKAVLAHPLLYHMSSSVLEKLVEELVKQGLDGLEAIYSKNRWADEMHMIQLAKRFGLKISGGTDFHGSNKPGLDLAVGYGKMKIPYELWERLKEN